MANPVNNADAVYLFPPGSVFIPTDEQLVGYYLTNKNDNAVAADDQIFHHYNVIKELDLYSYDPFNLPENTRFAFGTRGRKTHWFCYTAPVPNEGTRRTRGGFWRKRGLVRGVTAAGGEAEVGRRKRFVFYSGNSPRTSRKTDLVMYEYSLVGREEARFILCRVFFKPPSGYGTAESSCSEDRVPTVYNYIYGGVQNFNCSNFQQQNGCIMAPLVVEDSVSLNDEKAGYPFKPVPMKNDHEASGSGTAGNSELPASVTPNDATEASKVAEQVISSDAGMEELQAYIEEGDFIELDDLLD